MGEGTFFSNEDQPGLLRPKLRVPHRSIIRSIFIHLVSFQNNSRAPWLGLLRFNLLRTVAGWECGAPTHNPHARRRCTEHGNTYQCRLGTKAPTASASTPPLPMSDMDQFPPDNRLELHFNAPGWHHQAHQLTSIGQLGSIDQGVLERSRLRTVQNRHSTFNPRHTGINY